MTEKRPSTGLERRFDKMMTLGFVLVTVACLIWMAGGVWAIGSLLLNRDPMAGPALLYIWATGGMLCVLGAASAAAGAVGARRRAARGEVSPANRSIVGLWNETPSDGPH